MKVKQAIDDFVSLFFPRTCITCDNEVPFQTLFCLSCSFELPKTNFHQQKENPLTHHFWGRVPITYGAAFYTFTKGNKVQQLIHQIKYHSRDDTAIQLGVIYGHILKQSPLFKQITTIVPVPLHRKKLKIRGFNQSEAFGEGLSQSMNIPQYANALQRVEMTTTQTKKGRIERFKNVQTAFKVVPNTFLPDQHILLIDDVITTGATLEACALELLTIPNVKVSIATLAFAQQD